jgi:hypothetical protein
MLASALNVSTQGALLAVGLHGAGLYEVRIVIFFKLDLVKSVVDW